MSSHERFLYEGEDELESVHFDDKESLGETTTTGGRSKHRSMDLSGSVFLIASNGHVLNLPIPSESPDDPLNWANTRRLLIFAILVSYGAVSLFLIQTPGNLYSAFVSDFKEADMRPFTIQALASSPTIALGISFFFWIPLSVGFGRRATLVIASILLSLATVGAGFSFNFYQLLAALCLVGFAGGAGLSNSLLQLIDLSFIHERPLALASYWAIATFIPLLLLSQMPNMVDTTTEWRLVFKGASIPAAVVALAVFFFVPETHFHRPPVAFDGRVLVQSGTEKIKIYDEWREIPGEGGTTITMDTIEASMPPRIEDLPVHTWRVAALRVWTKRVCDAKSAFACFIQIFLCLANPLVFWVTLLNAVNFGGMMSIGIGFPVVMSQPPYNMLPKQIGLVNITSAIASFAALPASYVMLNNLMRALTKRNKGVRHAEFYLPAFVLPILTGAASVGVYAFAVARSWHPLFYHVAYGLNAFSFASGSIVNTIWVTESLPQWAAPGIAVVGGVSYMASYGITAVLPMWDASWGVQAVNLAIGVVILLVGLLAIPLAFWGSSVRQFISGRWGAYEAGALRPQTRPAKSEET